MKKILYSMLALAMAAFTLTSCEDVPAPYDDPNGNGGNNGTDLPEGVLLDQSFTSSLGDFKSVSGSGDLSWKNDYSSAMITGYQDFDGDGQKENQAGVTYLVSPELDLAGVENAYITINHALNYERGDINTDNSILISKNYSGDVTTATWEQLNYNTDELNSSFNFFEKSVNIPSGYMGSKVVVALRHTCTASSSSTWEVKSLKVQVGTAPEETPDTPVTGENLINNGDFESWTDGAPDNWKSSSTASSATLSQSTDAHTGTYSVVVGGNTSSNKRLAYKEITLKAGTYYYSFYTKAVTSDGGSVRFGYTPVTNGSVGNYTYLGSYEDVTNTEWKEISGSFTLDAQTTVCLVIMNSKTPGADVLIDDFSLVSNDGGITEDTDPGTDVTGEGYKKVTSISDGNYIISANTTGTSYVVATPLAESYTYGYMYTNDATENNGVIFTSSSNEFTFNKVDGGYTIQDGYGRYYYMDGTYNSFNVSSSLPSSGYIWDVSFNSDGTVNIKNVDKNKTVQYSSTYTSFGAYSSIDNTLPYLLKKQ